VAGTLVNQTRAAGVLLHVSSLPGGRLGSEAYAFVDWLVAARQSWWQILPLGPPNRHGSPYEALSAFAAWPGLLADPRAPVDAEEVASFRDRHLFWIGDWERFAGEGAVSDQVRFEREWRALRRYANDRGIRILGDMPVYVAPQSADHRLHPELFTDGEVAGVPPDYFSEDGQLWGSPLYDWRRMRRDGFRWWIERVRRALELVDAVRIDHFRGLVAYWAVPATARTARQGRWRRAAGRDLLTALHDALGDVPFVAEDLGVITPAVDRLRLDAKLPGMMVLQFEVGRGPAQGGRLWSQEDRVVYPGTHDNATVAEWLATTSRRERANFERSLRIAGIDPTDPVWGMVALAHSAPARLAVVSAQDLLGLGRDARMNTPSRKRGNWRWRLESGQLTGELAERLAALTVESGRAVELRGPRPARVGRAAGGV
jgi:4-alpha-glucanotransferase